MSDVRAGGEVTREPVGGVAHPQKGASSGRPSASTGGASRASAEQGEGTDARSRLLKGGPVHDAARISERASAQGFPRDLARHAMRVRAKICGITNRDDALLAVSLGADALGFVLHRPSPRFVEPQAAREIARALPPFVLRVAVFAEAPPEQAIAEAELIDAHLLQVLHPRPGEYPARWRARLLPAFSVRGEETLNEIRANGAPAFLLDAGVPGKPGGTGRTFDWSIARRAGELGRVVLAGGLTAENVARAIDEARPFAVDVASGVEADPGRKDPGKLEAFMAAVAWANARLRHEE